MFISKKIPLILLAIFLLFLVISGGQPIEKNKTPEIDSLQFPIGFLYSRYTALQQLQHYPAPRYLPGNKLLRLFNWADPYYFGGLGQPEIKPQEAAVTALYLQEELGLNWNYGIVIPNSRAAFDPSKRTNQFAIKGSSSSDFIALANKHPHIPLHLIIFWLGVRPKDAGFSSARSFISSNNINPQYYVTYNFYGKIKPELLFNFPDSFIIRDGTTQMVYLNRILKGLTRPIDMINENGEEPPGAYMLNAIKRNEAMIRMKDSMKIDSWEDFMATRKLQMRNIYSDCFMKGLSPLKKTTFTFYATEGGPINRFEWSILKKCMTPINGTYYSTPDFYPREPKNWKEWSGPWHGWKWIAEGRNKEIKDGDNLFSPFVAAGWSKDPKNDIRPGQWLGLLKCLGVVGAEFYYTGYFNEKKPFSRPAQYAWQMAMPAYAQAITSRYEDVLRNGNVLFNEKGNPIINYKNDDPHVLLTVRKHNKKDKYVISGTYQPFSNDKNEIPENKIVTLKLNGKDLSFEVRRQGSVYVYEKISDNKILFYQLDAWHENAHPSRWQKDIAFQAEVADASIDNEELFTETKSVIGDYTDATTYVQMKKSKSYDYRFVVKDTINYHAYIWIKYRGKGEISLELEADRKKAPVASLTLNNNAWHWQKITLKSALGPGGHILSLRQENGKLDLDKIIVGGKNPKF